jgi:hypothetical protein
VIGVVLLACGSRGPALDAVVAALPEGVRVVERVEGARPVLVLVEVAAGDPRAADAPPDGPLVQALLGAGVTAGVVDAAPDAWWGLLGDVPLQVVDPVPDPALAPLRRFAGLTEARATPLAGLRDMVLANAAPNDARRGWDDLRAESLRRFDAFEATASERGERLADAALGLDATPLVAVPPMAVGAALSRVRAEGRAVIVVRTAALDGLHDPPVWWARLRAALPAPAPAEGRLPAFTPWVEALRPHVAALTTWDEAEAIRADIRAQVGPPPPELSADDPRRAAVLAAAHRLRDGLVPGLDATTVLGDPVATVGTLRLCERPMVDTPMSYDPLFDVLKVDAWVADLPVDLVAVVLAHELVHVHDIRAAAASLGTDTAGWAFAHDTLPLGVARGISLLEEDRAFRAEIELVRAWSVTVPSVADADRDLGSDATPEARLRATLGLLGDQPGSLHWMQVLADLIPAGQ